MKDPYVYDGTDVLINYLDIRDGKILDKAESDFAALAINHLKNNDFEFNSIFDCLKIHKELFEKLYSWAGEIRTIDIYKGESLLDGRSIDYVFASYIQQALNELQKEFASVDWTILSVEEKVNKICYFSSEFWHIHPFREGNTRTTALMLYFLVKKTGLHVNIDFLSKNGKYFRNALVLSCLYSSSKSEYLLGIIKDSVTVKNISSKKYETINGVSVEKYSYTKHTMKKLQTIEKPADWKKNNIND